MKFPTMEEMLKAGMHFGHKASSWHPKMESYIYTTRNGLHILNLKKTKSHLEDALTFIEKTVAAGGDVLFVGTKAQANPLVEAAAKQAEMPYIKSRWIGGMLTNFKEVKKSIQRYVELLRGKEAGDWAKYTKKEQIGLQKEVDKLHTTVSGLVKLTKMPKAIFIVDIRTEKTALLEANVVGIPVIGVCDTNVNPKTVDYIIPANDDAQKGIEILVGLAAQACVAGMKQRKVVTASKTPVKKVVKKEAPKAEKKEEKAKA
jgi:small subunit ribosomal protein S2